MEEGKGSLLVGGGVKVTRISTVAWFVAGSEHNQRLVILIGLTPSPADRGTTGNSLVSAASGPTPLY